MTSLAKGRLILYGRGLIAEEYCRYLEGRGRGGEIAAFAVTNLKGQGETYCGRPCMEIGEALAKFPEAEVTLALQEKYHREVLELLKGLGVIPKEIIGLHRMAELLGDQGIREISAACPELTVSRNPYDYSMLKIVDKAHPERRFTFYPMTQVPLPPEELEKLRHIVKIFSLEGKVDREAVGEVLFIAMATSQKDAVVSQDTLPAYVHSVLGGAVRYTGPRSGEIYYDDEHTDNISAYNNLYSELTVAHWLWQKAPKANYLGLCHYRRHFVLTEELKKKLAAGTVDVLLTAPRLTFPSVHTYFAELPVTTMDEIDFQVMLDFIEKADSELAEFARDYLEKQIHFPNNMLIAKREIYLAYCRFMFGVLRGMQRKYDGAGIKRLDRYLGYVGELLTTVYFAYHCDRWRTEYIDYQLLKEI
ncbi:MAG: DUF4422 domain-containing protein [Selenomonas sp.]|nr:DUF4422 domain-containing protein [Selenomonas sp.]